jgi:hypothetical protein
MFLFFHRQGYLQYQTFSLTKKLKKGAFAIYNYFLKQRLENFAPEFNDIGGSGDDGHGTSYGPMFYPWYTHF